MNENEPVEKSDEELADEIRERQREQRLDDNREIETRFGGKTLENMRVNTVQFGDNMREQVLRIGRGEGSTVEKKEAVSKETERWDNFLRAVNTAQNMSERNPETKKELDIVIEGASAVLRKQEAGSAENAQKLLDEIKKIPGTNC